MKFDLEKKGYKRAQVDEYVFALKNEYESKLAEQKARIFQLKSELEQKDKAIADYTAKKDLIADALIKAMEKSDEIERVCAQRYREEMATLRAFHEKWQAHYNSLLDKYPSDEGLRAVERFNAAVTDILSGSTAALRELERQFDEESARVESPVRPEKAEEKAEVRPPEGITLAENATGASGFSFAEAWNPTDDLDTIMKDLGLLDDEPADKKAKKKRK